MSGKHEPWELDPWCRALRDALARAAEVALRVAVSTERGMEECIDRARVDGAGLKRSAMRCEAAVLPDAPLPSQLESWRGAWRAEEEEALRLLESRRTALSGHGQSVISASELFKPCCAAVLARTTEASEEVSSIAAVEESAHGVVAEIGAMVKTMRQSKQAIGRMAQELR